MIFAQSHFRIYIGFLIDVFGITVVEYREIFRYVRFVGATLDAPTATVVGAVGGRLEATLYNRGG